MATKRDFVVKNGLKVTDDINVSGDINVSSLYGRLNFKKNEAGNVNNDAIFFIDASDQYAGGVKYFHSGNSLRFMANQADQLYITDGAIYPPVDDDVDLGTSSLKFKDSFFGLVDAENFKINGGQGSDGQVLTSTGSGVAWEDAAGGGISDVVDDTTPQLGGNLDVNGNKITSVSNGNIVIEPNGSGQVQIGDSSLNPSGINLGKFIVSRDDTDGPTGPTMSLVDGDDDANAGPILKLYRNTASPADDDALGAISFNGEDSAGGERGYARIRALSDNVTSGSNSGSLEFRIFAKGTQTEVMQLEPDAQAGAKMTLMGVSQTGAVVSGASTANNSYLSLIGVATADHKAITASVHITDSTNNEVQTEMIVAHYDGSAVNYTTYGQIYDGAAAIGALEANLSGSNIVIQFKNTQGSTATLAGSVHATLHP